jgi:negative regulator of sigma E activity
VSSERERQALLEQLSAWIDGELDPESERELEAALRTSSTLEAALHELKAVDAALRELPIRDTSALLARTRARLDAEFRGAPTSKRVQPRRIAPRRPAHWSRLVALAGTSAAAAVALWLWTVRDVSQQPRAPQPIAHRDAAPAEIAMQDASDEELELLLTLDAFGVGAGEGSDLELIEQLELVEALAELDAEGPEHG